MIKLYILYIGLGFYMLYYSMLLWVFPFDGGILQTDLGLAASVILFFVMPAISLFKPNVAPVWGLLCLAAISPFGMHLLQYKLLNEYFIAWRVENIMMYVAVIWYFVTLAATINTFMARKSIKGNYPNKTVKFSLAFLPLIVFLVLTVYFGLQ